MSIFNRILYAVKDTDPRRRSGFAKVIAFAKACDASLEIFHAVSSPLYLPERIDEMTLGDLKRDTLDLHRMRLEKLAARARRFGVVVSCDVAWDHPPHEAIVRRAADTGADLIVARCNDAGSAKHGMRFTDWELVRSSPVPVLLLRELRAYRKPVVLAAVDPVHAHAKPEDLDESILAGARVFAATLRGKLHVLHVNHPPLMGAALQTPNPLEDLHSLGRRAFENLMSRGDLPAHRGHLVEGNPARVIPRVATELHAGLVVMGALSRSGLERFFIGDTAERVFGKLTCDVLIVKPAHFRARVPSARRGALVLAPSPASVSAR